MNELNPKADNEQSHHLKSNKSASLSGFSSFHQLVTDEKAQSCLVLLHALAEYNVIQDVDYQFVSFVFNELDTTLFQQDELNFLALVIAKLNNQVLSQHSCLDLNQLSLQNASNNLAGFFWLPAELTHLAEDVVISGVDSWLDILTRSNLLQFISKSELVESLDNGLDSNQQAKPLVLFDKYLYLNRYFLYEYQIAQFVKSGTSGRTWYQNLENNEIAQVVSQYFDNQIHEIDLQQQAVQQSVNKRFSIISGGPGTGKTTTVVKLLASLVELHQSRAVLGDNQHKKLNIVLAAPTGKAAARLSESITKSKLDLKLDVHVADIIPDTALTVHRLLKPRGLHEFYHHKGNPLHMDVLILDEASMIDLSLMAKLIAALPSQVQLILLGDKQQLASVEVGNVLAELCHSEFIVNNNLVTELTKSWRFDDSGGIGKLASLVKNGAQQTTLDFLKQQDIQENVINWFRPELNQFPQVIEQAVQHFVELFALSKSDEVTSFDDRVLKLFKHLSSRQILTCVRQGEQGVEGINQVIQKRLSQKGQSTYQAHYHCRPLMVSENAYHLNLYNGDIGLELFDPEHSQLMACFIQADGSVYKVLPQRLPKNETLYAMTVHKSQGSEFDHAILILPDSQQQSQILGRELIYTGLTRAKTKFSLYGRESFVSAALGNNVSRESGLAEMLSNTVR